jgi:thioredoxin 1
MAEGNINIVNVTEASFEADVLKSTVPVLVDFWAEWCGPCKMLIPVLNELATEYAGKVKIAKVNVDQAGMLAGQYNVQSIPALFFFKGGQVVAQMVGARSKKDLKAQLDQIA